MTWLSECSSQGDLHYFKQPAAVPLAALSMLGGESWFVSEFVKRDFINLARPTFSASYMKRLMDSKVMTPCLDTISTDFDRIFEMNKARRKAGVKDVLVFNAANPSPMHRFDLLIRVIEKSRALGKTNLKFRFFTQKDGVPEYMEKDFVERKSEVARGDLMSVMHEADIVFDALPYAGTALFFHEAVLSGALPVFLREPRGNDWTIGRIPADYPFIAKSEEELGVTMMWLADNLDSDTASKARDSIRAYVKDQVDQKLKADRWEKAISSLVRSTFDPAKYRKSVFAEMVNAVKEQVTAPMTSAEIGKIAMKASRTGTIDPSKVLSGIAFRRLMQSCGFKDVGDVEREAWLVGQEDWLLETQGVRNV